MINDNDNIESNIINNIDKNHNDENSCVEMCFPPVGGPLRRRLSRLQREVVARILADLRPGGIRIRIVDGDVRVESRSKSTVHFWNVDGYGGDDNNDDDDDDEDDADEDEDEDDGEDDEQTDWNRAKQVTFGASVSLRTQVEKKKKRKRARKRRKSLRTLLVIGQMPEKRLTSRNAWSHLVTASIKISESSLPVFFGDLR